jgi:1-deoxy-D-xylulose 5-phosphate reductoisomerase
VQIDYDVVHLRTSLVQLFVLLQLNFEEVVQIIELTRFGGALKGYTFAALHRVRDEFKMSHNVWFCTSSK